ILCNLAEDAARHRLYLPRELLHAHGIFATMPSYVLAQPALPHVCSALAERAAAYFADAERAILSRPRGGMLGARRCCPVIARSSRPCSLGAGRGSTSRFASQPGAKRCCSSDTVSSVAD